MKSPLFLLPAAKSTFAAGYDQFYWFLTIMSLFLFVLIVGTMFYFVAKYKRQPGDEKKLSSPPIHSMALELFWSLGPLIVCIGIFHWGVKQYMDQRVAPADALEVRVTAQKWSWSFQYANGKQSTELHVPLNKPVKLTLSSKDVLHSFYIPDYRVKYDAIPGKYTMVWFQATETGESHIFCTEYCGNDHSNMRTKVVVEAPEKFNEWLDYDETKGKPPVEVGKIVFEKQGCVACHSLDGSVKVGPSLKGIWDKDEKLTDGTTAKVDANYIRESVLNPSAKIVAGFGKQMPAYQGQLKDSHIDGLIEFIKSQK